MTLRNRPSRFARLAEMILVLAVLVSGCGRAAPEAQTVTPARVFETATSQPVTPISIPGSQDAIILSLEENGYSHLFLYIPQVLHLTRLTYGEWNDTTPALSPDGRRLAFASDRDGFWDLYVLDLLTGEVTRLTNTPQYDSSPTWSPDLAWIAFETYHNGHLDIAILSLSDSAQEPILLSDDPAADHSPAWAPDGRRIAFVSSRNGNSEIWLADLDKTEDGRFVNLSSTPRATETHPTWSLDGHYLAWASASEGLEASGIYVLDTNAANRPAVWVGDGDWPAWNAGGDRILAGIIGANQDFLTAYDLKGDPILLPTPLPGILRGLIWPKLVLPNPLPSFLQQAAVQTPPAIYAPGVTPVANVPGKRWYVVPLPRVQAPYPELHDLVDESYIALRQRTIREAGWDALGSLQNAFVPLTAPLDPGLGQDWLYTGRAFAINSLMTNAGWMAAVREDIGAQTYWRLYIRTLAQDGSQGAPIENPPWDLAARYELDPETYESGGRYAPSPSGYWIDFTALAQAYGWERLPALPNWRNYYAGARYTEFALTSGLDWYSAMLELYPPDILITPTRLLPPTATASRTPLPSGTPQPTRTPRFTGTPTLTRTPSSTPTPSNTPLPTSTPPTIIP